MSIEQAAAQAVAVVQRARALFGPSARAPSPGAPTLESAAHTIRGAGAQAAVMSGDLAEAHRGFINDATVRLTSSANADTSLHHNLRGAALLTQTGADQLDTITDHTRALAQVAAAARSPAAQRILLGRLRTEVQAANTVLNTTDQRSTTLAAQIRSLDYHGGGVTDPGDPDNHIQLVDDQHGSMDPVYPQPGVDPRNPFVGDDRFGYWQDVVAPPYVGSSPPPPWTGHRPMPNGPVSGPTGFYVPGGKTWADDGAAPMADLEEQYHFRISGVDYTGYTRTDPVDGHRQQWIQYTYEAQKFGRVNLGGAIWAPKGPNEITGELGGVSTGGLAGINPPPSVGPWQPISPPQIAALSAANPSVQYYMPNDCGGQFSFVNGFAVGGAAPAPVTPSIIAPR